MPCLSQLRFNNPTAGLWWEVVNHPLYVRPKIRHEVYQAIDEADQLITAFKEIGGEFATEWIDDAWPPVLKLKDILGSCAKRYTQLQPGNKMPQKTPRKYNDDFYFDARSCGGAGDGVDTSGQSGGRDAREAANAPPESCAVHVHA